MKKVQKFFIILVAVVFLLLAVGCKEVQFAFSYELDETVYSRGEEVFITATIKNVTERIYKYKGDVDKFSPSVTISCQTEDGAYELPFSLYLSRPAEGTWKVNPGEGGSFQYHLKVPEDAPLGEYCLILSYEKSSETYQNVLIIVE